MPQQNEENHYVPQMYLRNWSTDGNKVWLYRKLVSSSKVKLWEYKSIAYTAVSTHFYSHIENNSVSDEFEKWLNYEVETPAKPAFEKVVLGYTLSRDELFALIKFTVVQMVRTPAYYVNQHEEWINGVPRAVEKTAIDLPRKIKSAIKNRKLLPRESEEINDKWLPMKLSLEKQSDGASNLIFETAVGRSMLLSQIKRVATTHTSVLQTYCWHIIKVAPGIEWPTSDDPVIRLCNRGENNYNFEGGIMQKNVEIIFPLSPEYLLYTRVGSKNSADCYQENYEFSKLVRHFIFEHGFLHIYSKSKQKGMFLNNSRIINSKEYNRITEMLKNWHVKNDEIERKFF